MKDYEYKSSLSDEIKDFIKVRSNQGFKDKNIHIIQSLDRYLADSNIETKDLSEDIITGWLKTKSDEISSSTMDKYICFCNNFAEYLIKLGHQAFITERPLYMDSYVPYIFTEEETASLFAGADNMQFGNNRSRFQFPMLLRILYGCGLRLGEALSLRLDDINIEEGILYIKNAKNNRDRLVPVDETLRTILEAYCKKLKFDYSTNPLLFENETGNIREQCWARHLFRKLLCSLGYERTALKAHERGICLHCLRHTFAVSSLRQQEKNGIDSYDVAPLLSVYMGHAHLLETLRYLHMTTENAADILETVSQYVTGIFPEVPS